MQPRSHRKIALRQGWAGLLSLAMMPFSSPLYAQNLSESMMAGSMAGTIAGGMSAGNAEVMKNRAKGQIAQTQTQHGVGTREVDLDNSNGRMDSDTDSWQSTDRLKEIEVSALVKIDEIMENSGDYHYAAFGAPNPFARPESIVSGLANKDTDEISINGVEIPMVSSLQRFAIDRLKLNGIWQLDNGERRALILTPENEGVIVKINDPIAAGKVIAIEDKRLKTRQFSIRNDGVREYSEVDLYIEGYKDKPSGKIVLEPGADARIQLNRRENETERKSGSLIPTLPAFNDGSMPTMRDNQHDMNQQNMIPAFPADANGRGKELLPPPSASGQNPANFNMNPNSPNMNIGDGTMRGAREANMNPGMGGSAGDARQPLSPSVPGQPQIPGG